MASGRFACPTAGLDLDELLRRLRRAFWAALGLAIAIHLGVAGVDPFRQALDKTPRPLTTRFLKRQPRLTKPLELRKIPRPRRQLLQRQVRLLTARMDQVRAAATFSTRGVLGQVSAPSVSMDQSAHFASPSLEPALQAELIRGARQPESKVDMALEMLDIGAMDTGRYRAMVIQKPGDHQSLKGFAKVARVYSQLRSGGAHWDRAQMSQNLAIKALVENLNRYTGIEAEYIDNLAFDDIRLLEVPFIVYISIAELTEQELSSVARYLQAGGFVFGRTNWTEALEKHGSMVEGRDFNYGRLPNDHPIYRSYFDIGRSGPPISTGGGTSAKSSMPTSSFLEGLWIGDRLVALQGLNIVILAQGHREGVETTRRLQLAVNILVYALTQEGSVTHRLMQMVR